VPRYADAPATLVSHEKDLPTRTTARADRGAAARRHPALQLLLIEQIIRRMRIVKSSTSASDTLISVRDDEIVGNRLAFRRAIAGELPDAKLARTVAV